MNFDPLYNVHRKYIYNTSSFLSFFGTLFTTIEKMHLYKYQYYKANFRNYGKLYE